MNQGIMPRLAHINLSHINESVLYKCEDETNLFLVNVVSNMALVLRLRNVGPPTRHKFDIFDPPFLPFKLEVAIDCKEENI